MSTDISPSQDQQQHLVAMLRSDTEARAEDTFMVALGYLGFVRSYRDPNQDRLWTLTDKGRAQASLGTARPDRPQPASANPS